MTFEEKEELRAKYCAALAKAKQEWRKATPGAMLNWWTFDIEAHPEVISKLCQCFAFAGGGINLIDNSAMPINSIAFHLSELPQEVIDAIRKASRII